MSEVYRIGVAIMLTDALGPALSKISHQLIGVHKSAKEIEGTFNRWRQALIGAGSIMVGSGILHGMSKVAEHGKELLDQQDKLIRAGRTQAEVAQLTADAYDRITKAVPTSTVAEVLKSTNELTSVMGSVGHAVAVVPYALKLEALLGNGTGRKANGEGYNFWRAVEERGGTQLSEEARERLMGRMVAGSIATGGKVGGREWFTFAKRAGTSWMNMDEKMFGVLPTLIQSIGADTAGTSYMTATQMVMGAATLHKQQVEMMQKLHMLDMSKVENDHGRWKVGLGGIKGSLQYGNNLYEFAQHILKPALQEAGLFDDSIKRQAALAKIAPNRNAQRMLETFINPLTDAQILKDIALQKQALPLNQAYDNFTKNNPKGIEAAYHAQYESMMSAIGAPMMQAAMPVMRAVTDLFNTIGEFANQHGTAVKALGVGLAAVGAGLAALGAVLVGGAIIGAIGIGGWLVAGIAAFATAIGVAYVAFQDSIPKLGEVAANIGKEIATWPARLITVISGMGSAVVNAISNALSNAWSGVKGIFGGHSGSTPGNGSTPGTPGYFGKQGYNAVPPAGGASKFALNGAIFMDSRRVGEVVSNEQAKAMNGPLHGSAYYDGSATWMPADFSFARG